MSRTFRVKKSLAVSPNKSWLLVDFSLETAEGGSQWEETFATKIKVEKVATKLWRHIASIGLKLIPLKIKQGNKTLKHAFLQTEHEVLHVVAFPKKRTPRLVLVAAFQLALVERVFKQARVIVIFSDETDICTAIS